MLVFFYFAGCGLVCLQFRWIFGWDNISMFDLAWLPCWSRSRLYQPCAGKYDEQALTDSYWTRIHKSNDSKNINHNAEHIYWSTISSRPLTLEELQPGQKEMLSLQTVKSKNTPVKRILRIEHGLKSKVRIKCVGKGQFNRRYETESWL